MIKVEIEIDDVVREFTLPENWDEVTIEQFVKFFHIDRELYSQVELTTKTLNCFTGIDEELIMMMDVSDFEKLANTLSYLQTEFKPDNEVEFIELEGEKYYLKKDFNNLTMGEVISIETLLSSNNGNLFKVMDKLLCIFLRKKKNNGKLETFQPHMMGRDELFRKCPISSVYHLFSFFLNGGTLLDNNTRDYSVK